MTNKKLVRFYMNPEEKNKFKAQCALEGADMSSVLNKLIEEYLKEKE